VGGLRKGVTLDNLRRLAVLREREEERVSKDADDRFSYQEGKEKRPRT